MLRIRGLAVFITAALLAASVVAYQRTQAASPQATAKVAIQNFAFSPASLTVPLGTTVTWTNLDSTAHTATSDTSAWTDSGLIQPNHAFSHTFTKAGTFVYHCFIHPFMAGKIIVTAAGRGSTSSRASCRSSWQRRTSW